MDCWERLTPNARIIVHVHATNFFTFLDVNGNTKQGFSVVKRYTERKAKVSRWSVRQAWNIKNAVQGILTLPFYPHYSLYLD